MTTKNFTYNDLRIIKNEILGLAQIGEDKTQKVLIVGLKNEDVTLGVSHRLNKIVAKIDEEFKVLEVSLKEIKGDEKDEGAQAKRAELWSQETELSYEPISFDKIDNLSLRKNFLGEKYDYDFLIKSICEE